MKVIIAGGSGQVGTVLARAFLRDGHEVVVLSRKPVTAPWRVVAWDGRTLGDWASEFNGADVIIKREAWGIRLGLPASNWMLEVGAFFLRTETELILKSRRVVPGRLLQEGFTFNIPTWPEAARDLCRRWRDQQTASQFA